jgi:hypothetical protein
LNEKFSHITIEELRNCPEFEHLTEEMAQKMLISIEQFCLILSENEICDNLKSNLLDFEQDSNI